MTGADRRKDDQGKRRVRWYGSARAGNWLAKRLINVAWWVASWADWVKMRATVDVSTPPPPPVPQSPSNDQPPPVDLSELERFPDDFLWGAATAAFQVEGCIDNCDWNLFTTHRDIVRRVAGLSAAVGRAAALEPPGTAVHHRDLQVLKKDLDRAVLLGLNAYRFSIEWARVMRPDGTSDSSALQYYSDAVDAMMARKLEPIATLNHVTLPIWVLQPPVDSKILVPGLPDVAAEDDGYRDASGWENPDAIDRFEDYVEVVVDALGDRIRRWITLNEPVSMAAIGYLGGLWSPGFTLEAARTRTVYFNLIKAHARAYRAIKAKRPEALVGIAHAVVHFTVSSEASAVPSRARDRAIVGGLIGGILGAIIGGPLVVGTAALGAAIGFVVGGLWGAYEAVRDDPHERARAQADYFYNMHLLDSLTKPKIDVAIRHEIHERDLQDAQPHLGMLPTETFQTHLDFIGVNYYRNASVHNNTFLEDLAPYTGGSVFSNDMRNTRDLLADPFLIGDVVGDHYRNEDHGILNDLGWDMFPAGFAAVLSQLAVYQLPIIVTENGHAEQNDRNRASHLLAHLQQMRVAMGRGVNVAGYCYWSLVDTHEWFEGYNPVGRFGLFEVARPAEDPGRPDSRFDCDAVGAGRTFIRRITEGAIALQYFIANNAVSETPFREAIMRFGVMSPDGRSVEAPVLQAGALWQAQIPPAPRATQGTSFQLYLTRLGKEDSWLGMIFDSSTSFEWQRLRNIRVVENRGSVALTFEGPVSVAPSQPGPARPAVVVYQATTSLTPPGGAFVPLNGTVFNALLPARTQQWTADRILTVGLWEASRGSIPSHVAIRCWEGETFGDFRVKYRMLTPAWQPLDATTSWNGNDLVITRVRAFEQGPLALGRLSARLSGRTLTGAAVNKDGNSFPWSATRVAEDVGF